MTADRQRIEAELSELVAIPSITGMEEGCQEAVAERMMAAGLDVERVEVDPDRLSEDPAWPGSEMPRRTLPLVIGRLSTGKPGPRLLLLGHIDVVPAGDLDSWSSPPFDPVVRDGLLFGRGACDMKGGVVAMLEAARLLGASSSGLVGELILVSVPSEEDGGAGTLAALRSGVTADLAIIPEPTRLEVIVAHAGAITFTLDVPGKAAHASTRREGVSALEKLQLVVEALREDERRRNASESHPLMAAIGLPYPTIVGKVSGGEWASTVLDLVTVEGRYGVRLGQTPEEAAVDLRHALEQVWETDAFLRDRPMRLEITGGRFGTAELPIDHPLPTALAAAAERVTGTRPDSVAAPYGADMRLLVNEGAIPTVMYGPGDVRHAHAADEHVALSDVETCANVLAEWVRREMEGD